MTEYAFLISSETTSQDVDMSIKPLSAKVDSSVVSNHMDPTLVIVRCSEQLTEEERQSIADAIMALGQ